MDLAPNPSRRIKKADEDFQTVVRNSNMKSWENLEKSRTTKRQRQGTLSLSQLQSSWEWSGCACRIPKLCASIFTTGCWAAGHQRVEAPGFESPAQSFKLALISCTLVITHIFSLLFLFTINHCHQ